MKIKNDTILKAEMALKKICEADLPVLTAYKISKATRTLNNQLDLIKEQRSKLVTKYGQLQEDGQYFIAIDDKENFGKFVKDFNKVLKIEEDIEITKVNIDDLGDVKMSAQDIESISFMLDFNE